MLPLRHLNWFSARSMLYFLLPKRLRCGIETAWFPHSPRLCSHNLRVNYCFIYCFTCVIETNPQGCILSTKCLCVLLRSSLLIAIATPNKMLESMDLLRVSTQHLNRQVNRVMTRFLLRRICLITTIKSGRFILISAPLNV
jgi:hypothetical protein